VVDATLIRLEVEAAADFRADCLMTSSKKREYSEPPYSFSVVNSRAEELGGRDSCWRRATDTVEARSRASRLPSWGFDCAMDFRQVRRAAEMPRNVLSAVDDKARRV
jgi:hypothetical protein